MFQILAISGSLRAASSNTVVLQAAASLAPDGVQVTLYDGLGELPHFNPDLDTENPPKPVAHFAHGCARATPSPSAAWSMRTGSSEFWRTRSTE